MIWIIVIISLLLLTSIGVNIFVVKALNINLKKLDIYEQWVLSFQDMLRQTYLHLKEVDDRNLFEKDDDVGFVFRDIVNIIEEITKKSDIVTDASAEKTDK